MKKLIAISIALSLALAGCGHPLNAGTKEYPTYGLFNEHSSKSNNVCYELSVGNIVWSVILVESIIFPVYFIGWSIFNPVRMKHDVNDNCSFD